MRRLFHSTSIMTKAKGKKSNAASTKSSSPTTAPTKDEPIQTDKSGNISIRILAKPGAKQNAITDISSDSVGVQIAAPPTEGEANAELVKYLSKVLSLRKSDVSLDKGSRSRNKIVIVSKGVTTPEAVKDHIQREMEA